MAELDRLAPGMGVTVSRMMENAAYHVADYIRGKYGKEAEVEVYAGKGNNGGDALAAARRLHIWGFKVAVNLASRELDGIRREELEILEKLGVQVRTGSYGRGADLAVDGLIGYNLRGDPRPPLDSMVDAANSADEVVSVDLPTGTDPDTGDRSSPSVRADTVLTLAAPFQGLKGFENHFLVDIGVPGEAYREAGLEMDPARVFGEESVVEIAAGRR